MKKEGDNVVVGCWYPEINGLRAFAILAVIWMHSTFFIVELGSPFQSVYHKIASLGTHGVDLFFVISGFLITGILIDTFDQDNTLKKFYIRRTLRIFPVYYLTLIVGFILLYLMTSDFQFGIRDAMYFVYTQNLFPVFGFERVPAFLTFWSLAVEEQFYIFWPLLFLWVRKKSWEVNVCLILILFSFSARFILTEMKEYDIAMFVTFARMEGLSLGALLAILVGKYGKSKGMYEISNILLFFIMGTYVFYVLVSKGHYASVEFVFKYGFFIYSMFFFFLLMWILNAPEGAFFKKFLRLSPLQSIGRVSYGMYLFHWPIMLFLSEYEYFKHPGYWVNHSIMLITGVVLSYVLALISFNFMERPVLMLKDKFARYK